MKSYRPKPQFGRKEKTTQPKPLGYRLRLVGGKLVLAVGTAQESYQWK